MQKKENNTHNTTKDNSTPIPVWNDDIHYHDFLVELLSYGRKHNIGRSNIWDYEYV